MIQYKTGDMFESKCHTIVNPINCVGVMGGGLAKIFKEKYPLMFTQYKLKCDEGSIVPGSLFYYEPELPWDYNVLNFPTKIDWKNPSEYDIVRAGLESFVQSYKDLGITKIAFPALGCGLGGLDWNNIKPMMEKYLGPLDIYIEIYLPK